MQVSQQDYHYNVIRTSAVLTTSYVAADVIKCATDTKTTAVGFPEPSLRNQLIIYLGFTLGQLTSASLKIEFSHDGVTYYQESFAAISGGTDTRSLGVHLFNADGNYRLSIPIKDRFVKVSLIGTGVVTDSLASLAAIVGVA